MDTTATKSGFTTALKLSYLQPAKLSRNDNSNSTLTSEESPADISNISFVSSNSDFSFYETVTGNRSGFSHDSIKQDLLDTAITNNDSESNRVRALHRRELNALNTFIIDHPSLLLEMNKTLASTETLGFSLLDRDIRITELENLLVTRNLELLERDNIIAQRDLTITNKDTIITSDFRS